MIRASRLSRRAANLLGYIKESQIELVELVQFCFLDFDGIKEPGIAVGGEAEAVDYVFENKADPVDVVQTIDLRGGRETVAAFNRFGPGRCRIALTFKAQ